MNGRIHTSSVPPFPPDYRASGLVLPIESLPSPYGIGDVGPAAFAWVNRLSDAGQSWWQATPAGSSEVARSPHQPFSAFAGCDLLISPDSLIEDGLLRSSDCRRGISFSEAAIDYDIVVPFKHWLLETAWNNFNAVVRPDLRAAYEQFREDHANWLEDHALFEALKSRYNGVHYLEWPEKLVKRVPAALAKSRREMAKQIDLISFKQFLLFRQSERLKGLAHARGVRLIGELPFFASADSSDVWANPELFLLDDRGRPRFVAGVPPDSYRTQGQLWGNPVYDWEALRRNDYRWWIDRLRALLARVDVIRLEHFGGFIGSWQIPAEARTARSGEWVPGPGAEFFGAVQRNLGALPFFADDLGTMNPVSSNLRDQFEVPGTRVVQLGFDGSLDNPHLPHNYVHNTLVYTGANEDQTTRRWFEGLTDEQKRKLWNYLDQPEGESGRVAWELIRLAWSSVAAIAMTPLQDLLNLGKDTRTCLLDRAEGTWRWRCTEDMVSAPAFYWLRRLTSSTNRSPVVKSSPPGRIMEAAS